MATQRHDQIVETPTQARGAEPGPSVLALLTVSTGLAVLILGVLWFAKGMNTSPGLDKGRGGFFRD